MIIYICGKLACLVFVSYPTDDSQKEKKGSCLQDLAVASNPFKGKPWRSTTVFLLLLLLILLKANLTKTVRLKLPEK